MGSDVQTFVDDLSDNPLATVDDGWVLYHGTVEEYASSIEAVGLGHLGGTPDYWDGVQKFIAYWHDLFWGDGLNSYALSDLISFAQTNRGIRPVSLAHTFEKAARYARHEPGGEALGLLRRSIMQIGEALEDVGAIAERIVEGRERLYKKITRTGVGEFKSKVAIEAAFDALNPDSGNFASFDRALACLDDPSALVATLDEYRRTYGEPPEQYAGVVYAVQIRKADIAHMSEDRAAGINYQGIFSPNRLVGRVRLSDDRQIPRDIETTELWLRAFKVWGERLSQYK